MSFGTRRSLAIARVMASRAVPRAGMTLSNSSTTFLQMLV
jgi:hypothetical protein